MDTIKIVQPTLSLKMCVPCFIAIFTLLWWSVTKFAISLRYACT